MNFDTFITIGYLRLRSYVYLCALPFPRIGKLGISMDWTFNVHTGTSPKALQLPEDLHSSNQAGSRPDQHRSQTLASKQRLSIPI